MTVPVSSGADLQSTPFRRGSLDTRLTALLTGFFLLRPALDVLVTFNLGPNLNLALGGTLLVLLSAWLISTFATEPESVLPLAGVTALAFGASAILSAFGANDLVFSGSLALRVVTAALIFVVCEQLAFRYQRAPLPVVIGLAVGLASTATVAIGQLAEWLPRPDGDSLDDTRVPGPFPAPTVFATCMVIVVALIVGLAPLWWRRRPNLIWLLGPTAIGCTYLLLANGSRSPLGALLLAVGLMAIVQRRWTLIAPAVFAGIAVVALNPALIDRPLEVFDTSEGSVVVGAETNTMVFRLRYWERNVPLGDESPLVGLGLGAVEQANGENFPPHNTTLQAYIEMGIIGLLTHYALVIALAFALIRASLRTSSLRVRCYLSVAIGLGAGYFVMSFFENLLTQVVTTGPVAALTGLALGLARAERDGLAVEAL